MLNTRDYAVSLTNITIIYKLQTSYYIHIYNINIYL